MLLVYGLTQAEAVGFASLRTVGTLAVAATLIAGFWLIEARVAAPLVPLRIFRMRSLTGANLVAISLSGVIGAHGFLSTLYLQQVLGYSPIATGFAFLPLTLVIMVTAGVGSRAVGRLGPKRMMVAGMVCLAVGMLLLSRISVGGSYLGDLLPGSLFVALGLGLTFVTATIAATSGVAAHEQGVASGLINTSQQVGTAIGLAILVSVAAARTASVAGTAAGAQAALVEGFRWAFAGGAGLAVLGVLAALLMIREIDNQTSSTTGAGPATTPVASVE
jgi:predicted MFS family arabinose efflux permease